MAFPQYPQPQRSQPCDTFFVQGADQQQFPTSRICTKEQAKLVARERQYAMADAMSKAVSEDYQSDILAHMNAMDVCCPLPLFSTLGVGHPTNHPWLPTVDNLSGRRLHRYPDRDTMVHAPLPSRFPR